VIPKLMTYLKTHNPDCVARCTMAREYMAHRRRLQLPDLPDMQFLKDETGKIVEMLSKLPKPQAPEMPDIEIPGIGNLKDLNINKAPDLSKVKTTLLDIKFGKNWDMKKTLGADIFGGEFALVTTNTVQLRISLFGGKFEARAAPGDGAAFPQAAPCSVANP
jgi:hypothetical protein